MERARSEFENRVLAIMLELRQAIAGRPCAEVTLAQSTMLYLTVIVYPPPLSPLERAELERVLLALSAAVTPPDVLGR
jgi:hypothetical protein